MFGFRSSEFFWKNTNFLNLQKFCENSLKIISCFLVKNPCFLVKTPCFLVKNPCFGVKKFGKSWETPVLGSKTGVSEYLEFMENSEFVLFRTFRKLQKNDVKIEFWKLRKTCSDSKTNSNVWFKVRNAGPYFHNHSNRSSKKPKQRTVSTLCRPHRAVFSTLFCLKAPLIYNFRVWR